MRANHHLRSVPGMMLVKCQGRTGASRRRWGKTPEEAGFQVGEPEGVVAEADGIAAGSGPLVNDLVRGRRNLSQGRTDQRGPDGSRAETDFASMARDVGSDSSHDFAGSDIHTRDAAVVVVERPDGAGAGSEEGRLWAHRDRRKHLAG